MNSSQTRQQDFSVQVGEGGGLSPAASKLDNLLLIASSSYRLYANVGHVGKGTKAWWCSWTWVDPLPANLRRGDGTEPPEEFGKNYRF